MLSRRTLMQAGVGLLSGAGLLKGGISRTAGQSTDDPLAQFRNISQLKLEYTVEEIRTNPFDSETCDEGTERITYSGIFTLKPNYWRSTIPSRHLQDWELPDTLYWSGGGTGTLAYTLNYETDLSCVGPVIWYARITGKATAEYSDNFQYSPDTLNDNDGSQDTAYDIPELAQFRMSIAEDQGEGDQVEIVVIVPNESRDVEVTAERYSPEHPLVEDEHTTETYETRVYFPSGFVQTVTPKQVVRGSFVEQETRDDLQIERIHRWKLRPTPIETIEMDVDGLLGDIIEVDLSDTELHDLEFGANQRYEDPEIPLFENDPANSVGYVAQMGSADAPLELKDALSTQRKFWFVPVREGMDWLYVIGHKDGLGYVVRVNIFVEDGYSTKGPNAVTFGTRSLDIYRQQQRLKYFGYPTYPYSNWSTCTSVPPSWLYDTSDETWKSILEVDVTGVPTEAWARGVFIHAVKEGTFRPGDPPAKRHGKMPPIVPGEVAGEPSFDVSGKGLDADRAKAFINARNAPRWRELKEGTGYTIQRMYPSGVEKGIPQPERWATSWTEEVLQTAGRNLKPPNGSVDRTRVMKMSGTSLRIGGDTPCHETHETGMDIDIETPSSNSVRDPFYRVHRIPNQAGAKRYIASRGPIVDGEVTDKDGMKHVIAERNGQLVPVAFKSTQPAPTGALQHTKNRYESEKFLQRVRPFIVDNVDISKAAGGPYDLEIVRAHINAFRAVEETESGATAGRIWYNDPRTWDIEDVSFASGHGGHIHINVKPPKSPRT